MGDRLKHRGPDGSGHYINGPIGLVHTRLAVIDAAGGAQPMFNTDKRIALVFNGEIYNYKELRRSLQDQYSFITQSDTEAIIHLYEEVGIDCVKELRGMFAFALWDQREKKLFLARDRVGQKPLYYHQTENHFFFASEIRALLAGGVTSALNYTALDLYFKNQFITGPETIYEDIQSLPPGHCITLDAAGSELKAYWSPSTATDANMHEKEYCEALRSTLSEAVRLRLISDVPLGAFLSGGLDSSLIVALMRNEGVNDLKTFSIGFKAESFDETPFANAAAAYYQTEHQSKLMNVEAEGFLSRMIEHFDQPFGDASSLAVYQLSENTKKSVTVALSGDGSDELFSGYRRYVARKFLKYYHFIPKSIRTTFIERFLSRLPENTAYYRESFVKQMKLFIDFSNRLDRDPFDLIPETFSRTELDALYLPHVAEALKKSKNHHMEKYRAEGAGLDEVSQMMWVDFHSYLPDDILVKVDRMSMAHGLEIRSPFLDQEVVDLAMKMPINLKLNGFQEKYILKKTFSSLVPSEILNRKKHGFMLPLGDWFKGEWKPLLESVLLKQDRFGLLNAQYIRKLFQEHQEGRRDHSQKLWLLLVFFLWEESVAMNV